MVREFYFDKTIFLSFLILIIVGITFIYSATFVQTDGFYYLKKHIIALSVGLIAGFIAYLTPVEFYKRNAFYIFGASFLLLIIVLLVPGHYPKRWINLFLFNFQPSEFTKFATAVFLAKYISKKSKELKDRWEAVWVIYGIVFFFAALPIAIEPHKGAALYILGFTFFMLLSSRFNIKHVLSPVFILLPMFFVLFIIKSQYALSRFKGMIDPSLTSKEGYQSSQSMIAFAKGGLFGEGLGRGTQKLKYLPEIHTDYIFALIGEEIGFVGAFFVLFLFMVIFYKGVKISLEKKDEFTSLLGLGITYIITFNAVAHIMVNLNIGPSTGFTLPFVSFGGSSLIMNCIYMGILLRVSKEPNKISSINFGGKYG